MNEDDYVPSPARRKFLKGLVTIGGGLLIGAVTGSGETPANTNFAEGAVPVPPRNPNTAPSATPGTQQTFDKNPTPSPSPTVSSVKNPQ